MPTRSPYSSTTSAMCARLLRIRSNSSETFCDSGTIKGSRQYWLRFFHGSCSPCSIAAYRSLARIIPTMSSFFSLSMSGKRECPLSRIFARFCSVSALISSSFSEVSGIITRLTRRWSNSSIFLSMSALSEPSSPCCWEVATRPFSSSLVNTSPWVASATLKNARMRAVVAFSSQFNGYTVR